MNRYARSKSALAKALAYFERAAAIEFRLGFEAVASGSSPRR
jgi:hypothetical protein